MKFLSKVGFVVGLPEKDGDLVLGGRCPIGGAVSPNTGAALTQFARVGLRHEEFWIQNWELPEIHFLYSWKCMIHEGDFSYRYINNRIDVIEYRAGSDEYDGFPYDDYPLIFDEVTFGLRRVTEEEQAIIIKLNDPECDSGFKFEPANADLAIPTHQFGGVPYLLDSAFGGKNCPKCGCEMPLVASIGNKSYSKNEGFSGNDFVQVLYWVCASCHVVSAMNFCD